jgi:hypothetical protein
MRLDHFPLSPILCERLVDGGVDKWVRGEDNASDHAPAWIKLDLLHCPDSPWSECSFATVMPVKNRLISSLLLASPSTPALG